MPPAKSALTGLSLAAVSLLYAVLISVGLNWGLPSRDDDRYLFSGEPWPAERLADDAAARLAPTVGADVDTSPLAELNEPVALNATTSGLAEIYRRYRVFTRQPDEMITIMALSGMQPRELRFDPKLYQYGGLFIYPVGALIGACGVLGIYPVQADLTYYLARPESFGNFYLTARLYTAFWGFAGILAMYGIGQRLGGRGAGLLAALLFALLPVVTCMAHEAKPHLPGAVLMLLACLLAMRALDRQRSRDWALFFVCCGAAVGMVLSSAPIIVLIPIAVGIHCFNQTRRQHHEYPACSRRNVDYRPAFVRATLGGWLVAGITYLLTNPYVAINLLANRAVLRSNFGNSLAMYEIRRVFAGGRRVIELTAEGATWPVMLLGFVGAAWVLYRKPRLALPISSMALLVAAQFVLLGAGKPDEYGRFGVLPDCALAIGAALLIAHAWTRWLPAGALLAAVTLAWCAWASAGYVAGFAADARRAGSRDLAARYLIEAHAGKPIAVTAEPAPYGCPPLAFDRNPVVLYRLAAAEKPIDALCRWNDEMHAAISTAPLLLVMPCDDPDALAAAIENPAWDEMHVFEARPRWLPRGRISWADKPIVVLERKFHRL